MLICRFDCSVVEIVNVCKRHALYWGIESDRVKEISPNIVCYGNACSTALGKSRA